MCSATWRCHLRCWACSYPPYYVLLRPEWSALDRRCSTNNAVSSPCSFCVSFCRPQTAVMCGHHEYHGQATLCVCAGVVPSTNFGCSSASPAISQCLHGHVQSYRGRPSTPIVGTAAGGRTRNRRAASNQEQEKTGNRRDTHENGGEKAREKKGPAGQADERNTRTTPPNAPNAPAPARTRAHSRPLALPRLPACCLTCLTSLAARP